MIIRLVLLALLFPSVAFAQATISAAEVNGNVPALPYKGMLYSDDLKTNMSYNCSYDAQLACTFVETSLRKMAEPQDWDKQMPEFQRMLPLLNKGLDKECAPEYLNRILAVIKGEKKPETNEELETALNIREMDEAERGKYAELVANLCKTRDFTIAAREGFDRQLKTCTLSTRSYTLHFFSPTDEALWVSKDLKDNECGTAVSARFEMKPDKDGFPGNWKLTLKSQRPDGEPPPSFAPKRCEASAGERVFTLRSDIKTRYNCEYVLFEQQ